MDLKEEIVDINTASVEEFVSRLKGVGRSKAKAIVHFRTTVGKFKELCELTDVPGITQCILERNQGVLFCVNDISSLQRLKDNESPLEEGDLSESSIPSSSESEGDNFTYLNGQHLVKEQEKWLRGNQNLDLSLANQDHTDINGNDHQMSSLETPSTSIHTLDNCNNNSKGKSEEKPSMQSAQNRKKSKNDEAFMMSTRSRLASASIKKFSHEEGQESATECAGTLTQLVQAGPSMATRGKTNRARKADVAEIVKSARVLTRRNAGNARSPQNMTPTPESMDPTEARKNKIPVGTGAESGMEVEKEDKTPAIKQQNSGKLLSGTSTRLKQLFSKRKRVFVDVEPPVQRASCRLRYEAQNIYYPDMKRKLDSRLESNKFQSPEKKACKSVLSYLSGSNAPPPTFGEFKATTRGATLHYSENTISQDDNLKEGGGFQKSLGCLVGDVSISAGTKYAVKVEGLTDWLNKFRQWNPAERVTALDELIDACEPRQVRHMLEVIEPQFQRDFISLLPKELGLYVLSFLLPKDLVTAAQTCRYWHILAEDNLLWREKCEEEGILDPYYPKVCKNAWKCKKTSGINGSIQQPSAWKAAYLRQHKIEMNWRRGEHKSAKLLKGHDDHVITCLQFSGSRIVSGSDDNTLKVWSAVSGKCLRTLTGHTGGVWASQMRKNMIISGSTDRTLKIWNADTGQCSHTLYGHTSTVRCMALHDNIVISGSRDATLRVWDVDTGECLHVLTGHMAAVRCVCYDGKLVVTGAYDYMVKVWDPIKEECLHTLQGHTNRVYSLQFDGTYVVSGSLDTSIRVWSVETGLCLHTLVGHQSLTSGMELKNNILVSGNADSTVKMWDIITGDCLKTLEGPNKHQSAVTCLQFYGKFVITSSDDGTVKLWDVKTGKVLRDLVSLESRGSGGVVWRIRASQTKLVCAIGSRNGTEETKLLVLDFDPDSKP